MLPETQIGPDPKLGCCFPPWELTEVGEYQGALGTHGPEVSELSFPWLVKPCHTGMAFLTFPGAQHLAADGIKAG